MRVEAVDRKLCSHAVFCDWQIVSCQLAHCRVSFIFLFLFSPVVFSFLPVSVILYLLRMEWKFLPSCLFSDNEKKDVLNLKIGHSFIF